jgi:trehalose synthase
MAVSQVSIAPLDWRRFAEVLTPDRLAALRETAEHGRQLFDGRVLWTVNSTARGGGVAELLTSLIAYVRGGGVDARWMVIGGNPDFFRVTKRIHNRLHGFEGDGGPLTDDERAVYERALEDSAHELAQLVQPGDAVLLHDPQTAGLVAPLVERGAQVVWRCHVGLDRPNELAREAWRFLHPYVEPADAYVFSRESFVWEDLDRSRLSIIPPSIDAFSPKNAPMDAATVDAILGVTGIAARNGAGQPTFVRQDGGPGRVDRPAEAVQARPLEPSDRVLVQVSRWDRLKDPIGVMEGFARIADEAPTGHLMLAGPSTAAVADDPEGAQVLRDCLAHREGLDASVRDRVHLVSLPMDDLEENAAIVNAVQRRAQVLAQKSLAEGFGLTVAEGMWKARPVIGTQVGGIQDQIADGQNGVLVEPEDLDQFGQAALDLLTNEERARELGEAARETVRDQFLGSRTLEQYFELFEKLLSAP